VSISTESQDARKRIREAWGFNPVSPGVSISTLSDKKSVFKEMGRFQSRESGCEYFDAGTTASLRTPAERFQSRESGCEYFDSDRDTIADPDGYPGFNPVSPGVSISTPALQLGDCIGEFKRFVRTSPIFPPHEVSPGEKLRLPSARSARFFHEFNALAPNRPV